MDGQVGTCARLFPRREGGCCTQASGQGAAGGLPFHHPLETTAGSQPYRCDGPTAATDLHLLTLSLLLALAGGGAARQRLLLQARRALLRSLLLACGRQRTRWERRTLGSDSDKGRRRPCPPFHTPHRAEVAHPPSPSPLCAYPRAPAPRAPARPCAAARAARPPQPSGSASPGALPAGRVGAAGR